MVHWDTCPTTDGAPQLPGEVRRVDQFLVAGTGPVASRRSFVLSLRLYFVSLLRPDLILWIECMPSRQVLDIKILSCGGMFDLMSELEAAFLVEVARALPKYRRLRTRHTSRKREPRPAHTPQKTSTRGWGRQPADLLHLIGHADASTLQTGDGRSLVTASEVEKRAIKGKLTIPEVVVCTNCKFQSSHWRRALKAAGVKVLIASSKTVTPANLTALTCRTIQHCYRRSVEEPKRSTESKHHSSWPTSTTKRSMPSEPHTLHLP